MKPSELIKWIRLENKLNTQQFGEKLGVSGRTIENWEQGRYPIPAPVMILIDKLWRQ